jgi:hypothetical protein
MGIAKEEKGVLDYLPCMSVNGQKHLRARIWNTSLPSSTPTGIAPRDRGFWKGLSVVSFGRSRPVDTYEVSSCQVIHSSNSLELTTNSDNSLSMFLIPLHVDPL